MTALTVATDRDDSRATVAVAPPGARVPVEVHVVVSNPFDAYRRARRDASGFFYETIGGQPGRGAFSVDPAERLTADALTDDDWGDPGVGTAPSPTAFESSTDPGTFVRGDCDASYPCGLFGWLSYDAVRELESLPEQTTGDRGLPHLQLGLYDLVASWAGPRPDDGETTLRVTCCPVVEADEDLDVVYDEVRTWATDLTAEAVEGEPEPVSVPVESDEATLESACGREAFADCVRAAKRYVHGGDTFQASLSQRLVAPVAVHPVNAYAALREVNLTSYSGSPELPGVDLASASPELFLRVEGDRLVTEPIVSTRPRGATTEENEVLETDLTIDEKERAKHAMLVDLERDDLGKVSEYGSVEVTKYRRVDRYSEVMYLVFLVEGTRRKGASLVNVVAVVLPGGIITGVPKPRTMETIDELETTRHGPYTGSMLVVGFDNRAVLNIVIRTLVRFGDKYHLRVGAGIVHDSDPQCEYDETLAKTRALIIAIDEALGERANMTVGTER